MRGSIFLLLIVTFSTFEVECLRTFFRGRSKGGNYGKPINVDRQDTLPPDQWFQQKLDHFRSSDVTWPQRYFTNDTFFDKKNPRVVFLMIGGEGKASPEWMVAGQWIEYAKKFNALCFQLEHRFYGESHPTDDMGVKNLVYLNSEQALADLANFIVSMNDQYNFDNTIQWVVFGGSYPGSLAAWMRLKYPHLVHAAVSSSGPLLAKVDFMGYAGTVYQPVALLSSYKAMRKERARNVVKGVYPDEREHLALRPEYYTVVVDALNTYGPDCVTAVKEGTRQLNVLNRHLIGVRSIDKKFRLCDPLEKASKLDKANFYESLASNFAGVVQYNKDNRIGESKKMANITIDLLCRMMTDKSAGSEIDRLANINSMLLNISNQTCMDYNYNKMVKELSNIGWNSSSAEGGRQWTYQTCTEFGFYQTSSAEWEIFGNDFPVDYFVRQCQDIFGSKFNSHILDNAVDRTNMMYGALDIETQRVVFVHGSIDPWHALGITKTRENGAPAIYIEGTAHCANMYPPSDNDLPDLKAARANIEDFLSTWLEI